MPSVKQGGGYTLTFSKKNQDIKEHLDNLKENKVTITDYLCEAVRFYEQNKDKELNSNTLYNTDIERLIEDKIKALMSSNLKMDEDKDFKIVKDKNTLEDNLDSVTEDDIEED